MDPIQHRLIPVHVTLCRDEELGDLSTAELSARLAKVGQPPLTLQFGPAESFDGHGVLLRCLVGEESYHRLRAALLRSDAIPHPRAHITLAHPRNPRASANVPSAYEPLAVPFSITFTKVSLIEQEAGHTWQILKEGNLVVGGLPRGHRIEAGVPRCPGS